MVNAHDGKKKFPCVRGTILRAPRLRLLRKRSAKGKTSIRIQAPRPLSVSSGDTYPEIKW